MMTLEEYVNSYGFEVSDLTESELKQVQSELDKINCGEGILGGVLSSKQVYK